MKILHTICFMCLVGPLLAVDFYELLGVTRDASKATIRKAFKKLALEKHPDKNKDDPSAHDTFTQINKAYEVLKDDELRKKYDTYGEEGLKDDHFGGQYQSWDFYKNEFGIYDNDPEVITLSKSDFEQSVAGSEDIWFINFYSPRCSHCHTLAPTWREVAKELDGIVRIGAINCHDDWMLCNSQQIGSYPSLKIYPAGDFYHGQRDVLNMVDFMMKMVTVNIQKLDEENFVYLTQETHLPWIISFCHNSEDCLDDKAVMKLAAMTDKLAHVGEVNCNHDTKLCQQLGEVSSVVFYPANKVQREHGTKIASLSANEIMDEVLNLLPDPIDVNEELYESLKNALEIGNSTPWLIVFISGTEGAGPELKKLTALVPDVNVGRIDCQQKGTLCAKFHVTKYPSVMLQKVGGYEFHHGRYSAHDIANFARESAVSNVVTLGPPDFPGVVDSKDNWFIDFFAPWCPPCMRLLPEWRKAGKLIGGEVTRFGTVDCTAHHHLCKQMNIHSYPSAIFYNGSSPHKFSGDHSAQALIDFVEDIRHPPVYILTPETFEQLITGKGVGETWVVDFYAPWCGPCMQLAPTFRQLAKRLEGEAKLGQVDCQAHQYLCSMEGVNSYPTLRLYPEGSKGKSHYVKHQGWRDIESLYAWVFSQFPSSVGDVESHKFHNEVLTSEDAWVLDFYAPWCGHCVQFAPHYQKLAKRFDGAVKFGKVNCEVHYGLCREVGIREYPSVRLYHGAWKAGMSQPIGGTHLEIHDHEHLYYTIKNEAEGYAENRRAEHEREAEKKKKKKKKKASKKSKKKDEL